LGSSMVPPSSTLQPTAYTSTITEDHYLTDSSYYSLIC
jgi:hypothetical protein